MAPTRTTSTDTGRSTTRFIPPTSSSSNRAPAYPGTTEGRGSSSTSSSTPDSITPSRYQPTPSAAAPRRVPFPRLTTSGIDTGSTSPRTSGTSRLSGSSTSGSPYVRSTSGPSVSRLRPTTSPGIDRGTSRTSGGERSGPSSRQRGGDTPSTARVPSSRTVDRDAILERYGNRLPRETSGGDTSGPSRGRAITPERKSGTPRSGPADLTERRERTSGTRSSGERGGSALDRTRPSRLGDSATGGDGGSRRRGTDDLRTGDAGSRRRGTDAQSALRVSDNTRRLREVGSVDPRRAERLHRTGRSVSAATRATLSVGIGVSLGYCSGFYYGGYYSSAYWGNCWYGYPSYSSWWAYGGYPYSRYCHPYSWPYYWWYGSFPNYSYWWGPNYPVPYYSVPVYYSSVITNYTSEPEVIYVEQREPEVVYVDESVPVGEAVAERSAPAQVPAPSSSELDSKTRASGQYLTLGDQAFRDGRYADAVHFYARAVEYAPDEGVLYLVLSDGLFATGDYHYGAYALRKAFELDPSLAASEIDKHTFYTDPIEFDQQLAVLEGFVLDHAGDDDARLMLAANYLFGGRPAAAVDLLEDPAASALRGEDAGALLLAAAREQQFGVSR